MTSPIPFNHFNIDTVLYGQPRPGVYILGIDSGGYFVPKYVGRSDTDLRDRLLDHIDKPYPYFKYEYCLNAVAAHKAECYYYHQYGTNLQLDNLIHPDAPVGLPTLCHLCLA